MSNVRRVNDRRRRVLYTAQQADQCASSGATRSEVRRLREARRPPVAYGSRVHRRLRGRWFSLVPVSRRAMIAASTALLMAATVACIAHYLAVSWPSIAYRPEIARPLRLDRPDGFGHCMMLALLTASTGISLLIYQLRRYRNDDFKGHYRLWRLVIVVAALASINTMVGMIDWGGAILDALFGKRVALTGSDWIRLVVSFGGVVLGIRLLAEVRRCRSSLVLMLIACGLFLIPEAAKWNVLTVDSLTRWILVTSAPLLACTTLFLSLVSYLRMLYREVRQIEDGETAWERLRQWRRRLRESLRRDPDPQDTDTDQDAAESRGRSWWKRNHQPKKPKPKLRVRQEVKDDQDSEENEAATDAQDDRRSQGPQVTSREASQRKTKRRWFGLRGGKSDVDASEAKSKPNERVSKSPSRQQTGRSSEDSPPKRSRFSLRLRPPRPASQSTESKTAKDQADDSAAQESNPKRAKRPKRGSLFGWLRRDKDKPVATDESRKAAKTSQPNQQTRPSADQSDDNEIDATDIDWDSLSKSERRRLRKQLKRQNRAA
jgi:hypothetical protein